MFELSAAYGHKYTQVQDQTKEHFLKLLLRIWSGDNNCDTFMKF